MLYPPGPRFIIQANTLAQGILAEGIMRNNYRVFAPFWNQNYSTRNHLISHIDQVALNIHTASLLATILTARL
jgi:hypothetical protein